MPSRAALLPRPCRIMWAATGYDPQAAPRVLDFWIATLRERHNAGLTATALAAESGVSIGTAANWMRLAGISLKRGMPHGAATKARRLDHDEILARCRAGGSICAIAKDAGVSRQYISQVMHKAGIRRDDPATRAHVVRGRLRRETLAAERAERLEGRDAYRRAVVEKAKRLQLDGYSATERAVVLGVPYATLLEWIDRHDPSARMIEKTTRPIRSDARLRNERLVKMELLRNAGASWTRVAQQLGISIQGAYSFARRHAPHLIHPQQIANCATPTTQRSAA